MTVGTKYTAYNDTAMILETTVGMLRGKEDILIEFSLNKDQY